MTTLINLCQDVELKIESLELARRNAHVRALVAKRTKEWAAKLAEVRAARERAAWLSLNIDELPVSTAKFAQLRHNASESLARLKAGENVSSLTEDAMWTRLLHSADGAAQALTEDVKTAWRAFVDAQGSLGSADELRGQAIRTPKNEEVIAAYRTPYTIYIKLRAQPVPRSGEDRTLLLHAMEACRAFLVEIDHDVPADVQEFFRAVFAGKATLASVTPSVLLWLGEHGHLQRYRVGSAAP